MSEAQYKSEYQQLLIWVLWKYPKSQKLWLQYKGELKFWDLYLLDQGIFPGKDPDMM